MCTISIVIPVYNIEQYLRECLDSVHNQTFTDWECICVDDGSTDSSGKILDEYATVDSRFKIIHQNNAGGSVARNVGLDVAAGEYVAFLDSDDFYHPQYLEILHHFINHHGKHDLCVCTHVLFDEHEPFTFTQHYQDLSKLTAHYSKHPLDYKFVYRKHCSSMMWDKLYRHDLIKDLRFNLAMPAFNDIPFNLEVLQAANSMSVLPYDLIAHRVCYSSQTFSCVTAKKLQEFSKIAEFIYNFAQNHPVSYLAKLALQRQASKGIFNSVIYESMMYFNYDYTKNPATYQLAKQCLEDLLHRKIIFLNKMHYIDRLACQCFLHGDFPKLKYLLTQHKTGFMGVLKYAWKHCTHNF